MHITVRRVAAPLIIAAGAIALGTAPASAHAEVTPSTTVAGEYAVLTFSIGHGCDGSPTNRVAIDIPEGIDVVTPTINDGWKVSSQTEATNGSGEESERVKRVTYSTRSPLPDGYRDTFELAVPLPNEPGETLVFPTVQTCEKGEIAWSQVPKEGQSVDDLDSPAPSFTLTAAESGSAEAASASSEPADTSDASDTSAATDDSSDGLAWAALAVGAVGVGIGGVALARSRTRS